MIATFHYFQYIFFIIVIIMFNQIFQGSLNFIKFVFFFWLKFFSYFLTSESSWIQSLMYFTVFLFIPFLILSFWSFPRCYFFWLDELDSISRDLVSISWIIFEVRSRKISLMFSKISFLKDLNGRVYDRIDMFKLFIKWKLL